MNLDEMADDEIVISGVGCSLPDVSSLEDLNKLLFDGTNPIQHDDSDVPVGYYGSYPEYQGHIRDPWKFDCTFFGVSKVVARSMDPMVRKILERTFEAILDAGMNPADLKGSNSAFFSGTTFSDYDLEWDTHFRGGYGIMGRNRCMNANRVSYWLDCTGTSLATDCNWADGIVNLELAWNAIKNGHCDTAVVNGASITIHNELMLQIRDMGVLCNDGKTKAFDDAADGYVRSDGVVVLVLQRASVAKRCYATVSHVFSQTCGSPNSKYSMSSEKQWYDFLRRFYETSKINPLDVCYYEANGNGIREEDAKELNAATAIFCENRESPLYIGSIKSNIGHTEAASALTSVVKAILCLENQEAPKNLHFNNPNSLVPGLFNGKLEVCKNNTALPKKGLVAVSAYGYGGVYAHVVLKPNTVTHKRNVDSLPRLIFMADRMADTIETLLDKIESMPYNEEYYGLLHDIHSKKVGKYLGRGYTILPKQENIVLRETSAYNEEKRPVWFIFSGMGSQWNGMGKSLLALPLFRQSIERSAKVMATKNIDLFNIITSEDPTVFDNILHAFVGIAAIQIALVDILNALEVVPDGIIGHSVGELGCSYADGGLTAEQMILCAYYRGLASIESELIAGFMAAIGKGYNGIKDDLPPEIDVACHNSSDSCTLSGPAEIVKEVVSKLKADGVFAKTVNVANIAYHSRYIAPVAPKLLKHLQTVITDPKPRSSKWISTSNLEEDWETEVAKYCSAEYHTKNLLNAVLFEEGSRHIPANAICIEIAPHGLLQAILKRSLDPNSINIPLTRRTAEDSLLFLLQAFGKMYLAGMHPQISKLYPAVQFPVPRGTPSLTHLVHWNFEHEFSPNFRVNKKIIHSIRDVLLKTNPDSTGCIIDGNSVYPASIYLRLAWDISAKYVNKKPEDYSVVIRNFRLDKPFFFDTSARSDATIMINSGTRYMEICTDDNDIILNCNIYGDAETTTLTESSDKAYLNEPVLHSILKKDIYADFKHRGYEFSTPFQPIERLTIRPSSWIAYVPANLDWTQKLEALIQLVLLQKGEKGYGLLYPVSIGRIVITPEQHLKETEGVDYVEIVYSVAHDTVKCPGLEISGIKLRELEKPKSTLAFEKNIVVPYQNSSVKTSQDFIEQCIRIVHSNMPYRRKEEHNGVNILRIVGSESSHLGGDLQDRVNDINVNLKLEKTSKSESVFVGDMIDLVIGDFASLKHAPMITGKNSMVLVKAKSDVAIPAGFVIISSFLQINGENLYLLNKARELIDSDDFLAIPDNELVLISVLNNRNDHSKTVHLIGDKEPIGGCESYIQHVEEATSVPLRWLFVLDKSAPKFTLDNDEYRNQLRKGLLNNVLIDDVWSFFVKKLFTEKKETSSMDIYAASVPNVPKESEISVDFIGINLDASKTAVELVTDFSGKLRTGTPVMGIISLSSGCMTHDPNFIWQVPSTWSQEDAASAPLPFLFAYYTMSFVGQIFSYENVLVTDALTPNGQAAIMVALKYARSVYATVETEEEKSKIAKIFPQIKTNHIFSHQRNDFNLAIGLELEEINMPQVIFNTLEGEKLVSALRCLSSFGRFYHFGKEDIEQNKQIGSFVFMKYNTLYPLNSNKLVKLSLEDKEALHRLFCEGIRDGTVKPFSHVKVSQDKFSGLNRWNENIEKSQRVLFDAHGIRKKTNALVIDADKSYVIIGDSTDIWLDLAESLQQKGASKIVIVRSDNYSTERTARRIEFLTKNKNSKIVIYGKEHLETSSLIRNVQMLGPIASVFLVCLDQQNGIYKKAEEINKIWREKNGHFIVISRGQRELANLCEERMSVGLPSSNLLWEADGKLVGSHLEWITQLSGREAVISVTNSIQNQSLVRNAGKVFLDNIPRTLDDFCLLGESLSPQAELVELSTLGVRCTEAKNLSPFIVIPSLHSDPIRLVSPLARRLRYPVLCAKLPHTGKQSIEATASCLVEQINSLKRKNRTFNVVGISWGCAVAIELAKQLEEQGGKVSLILIDNPMCPIQQGQLTEKTIDAVLLSLLASKSKKVKELALESWRDELNLTVSSLELEPAVEHALKEGASYVNWQLGALIKYDVSNIRLKGPLAVLRSDQLKENFCYTKVCHNVEIRDYSMSLLDLLDSDTITDLLHQAAICDDMAASSIHQCTWTELETFIVQDREASSVSVTEASYAYMRPLIMTEDEKNIITL